MTSKTLLVLTLTAEVLGVQAIWPFDVKVEQQYTAEGMVDAGSLGIEGTGRVVAVGDWDGDQQYVK
jgi:integrin alpha FG-GAP repeat containing protein 1